MKLNIADSIRRLRQEKNVTQEELASAIGVTAQAVSKWERAEGYPDITLLPEIAEFFGVTLDDLCGVDEQRKHREIAQITNRTMSTPYQESVAIAREGLAKYPQSYRLKENLAFALTGCLGQWTPPQDVLEEIIHLYEDIIAHCPDMELRNNAIAAVCHIYELAGKHEKATETAQMLYGEYERQKVWCQLLKGEELVFHIQNCIIQTLPNIDGMLRMAVETACYSTEEKILLCRKMIAIFDLVGEGHDWPVGLIWSMRLSWMIAEFCLELGDRKGCFDALDQAAEFAVCADSLVFEGKPKSLLLNRIDFEYLRGMQNDREYLRHEIEEKSCFDCIRDTPEYAAFLSKLQ